MRNFLIIIGLSLLISNLSAQEEEVKGIWYNTEKTSKIKIFKATNGKYYGKVIWLENAEKKDDNNPDPEKRNDPIMGMLIVKAFNYDSKKRQWVDGSIYDPRSGKTYDCYMWFEDGNTDVLHLKGYVMGMKFAGKKVQWTRTSE